MTRAIDIPAAVVAPSAPGAPVAGDTVTIETDDKLRLEGTYFAPKGKGRAPAALLVHDAGADRTQMNDLAAKLQKKGFAVLTVDLRGHGGSKTDRLDWSSTGTDDQSSLWQLARRDVEASAAWLLRQKEVHSTNLSLVGYRAGCALAARHAEDDENVISMLLLAPKKEDHGFDVEQTIKNVTGLPTCVIDKKSDETEAMVNEANDGSDWIEMMVAKKATILDDSRTISKAT